MIIFKGTNGLNTKDDPARLGQENNILDLAVAADIDISDTGRISRRKGYTKRTSTASHSLFCAGGPCLFVAGTGLYELHADYSSTLLTTVTANALMNYVQVNNQIYFCNGYEKGIIKDSQAVAWEKGTYYGPETDRVLSDPPIGTLLTFYRNRIYMAQKNVLWYSEPGAYGVFDLTRGFIMYPTDIRMIQAVDDGIFVSDSTDQYFLSGKTPLEFEQVHLVHYPAITYSNAEFNGRLTINQYGNISINEGPGKAALWLSSEGICYGGPGGFFNVSQERIADFPSGLTGSGIVYKRKYVGLIDP